MKRCLLLAALAAACSSPPTPAPRPAPAAPSRGLDVSGMDASVRPGADFFAYANGGWLKRTEIPADRSGYGTGAILSELTAKRTAELIAEAAEKAPAGSDARKVGDYYATFLDEAAVEAKGLAPLRPALDRVATVSDAKGLARALGEGLRADVDAFNATDFYTDNVLGLWVAQDLDDPSRYAPFLLQGGLGLPDRSYYVDDSPKMAEVRDKYRAHVAAMLELAGVPDADAKAKRVFDLEARLAKSHATRRPPRRAAGPARRRAGRRVRRAGRRVSPARRRAGRRRSPAHRRSGFGLGGRASASTPEVVAHPENY
jgi:putative endopeptidase